MNKKRKGLQIENSLFFIRRHTQTKHPQVFIIQPLTFTLPCFL